MLSELLLGVPAVCSQAELSYAMRMARRSLACTPAGPATHGFGLQSCGRGQTMDTGAGDVTCGASNCGEGSKGRGSSSSSTDSSSDDEDGDGGGEDDKDARGAPLFQVRGYGSEAIYMSGEWGQVDAEKTGLRAGGGMGQSLASSRSRGGGSVQAGGACHAAADPQLL